MVRKAALDNPAKLRNEDEFSRWPFSRSLAETIISLNALEGAPVLGLFGKWGYGKSTVLNFVRTVLEEDYGANVVVYSFNPWLIKDQDALIREFFSGLAKTIESKLEHRSTEIVKMMAAYGEALSPFPVIGMAGKTAQVYLNQRLKEDTVQTQLNKLTKHMESVKRKVIVLIDDMDRLDRDEIMALLKMVRLSGNFPNLVYLLAFDEERIARVAGHAYGELAHGRQFLEKIVQYPFSLPNVPADRLWSYVKRHVRAACEETGVRIDEELWNEFGERCRDPILSQLTTPRQAIRYANALRFALSMLKGEADPFLQMTIEAIRILFPDLYSLLKQRDYLAASQTDELISTFQWTGTGQGEMDAAQALVRELVCRENNSTHPLNETRFYLRYFSYAVEPDDISDTELTGLLTLAEGEDQHRVNDAVRGLALDRLARLTELVPSKVKRRASYLTLSQANRLAIALSSVADLLQKDSPMNKQPLAAMLGKSIAELASHDMILRNYHADLVAPSVVEKVTPLSFALVFYDQLHDIEKRYREEDGSEKFEGHDWKALEEILGNRIRASAFNEPPYDSNLPDDALQMMLFWCRSKPSDERDWLEKRLAAYPGDAGKLLELFPHAGMYYNFLAELANPEIIVSALASEYGDLLKGNGLLKREIDNARCFVLEHERKSRKLDCGPAAA